MAVHATSLVIPDDIMDFALFCKHFVFFLIPYILVILLHLGLSPLLGKNGASTKQVWILFSLGLVIGALTAFFAQMNDEQAKIYISACFGGLVALGLARLVFDGIPAAVAAGILRNLTASLAPVIESDVDTGLKRIEARNKKKKGKK